MQQFIQTCFLRKYRVFCLVIVLALFAPAAMAQTPRIVSRSTNACTLSSGEYIIEYKKGVSFFSIRHRDNAGQGRVLALQPGGGKTGLDVFNPAQISKVACTDNAGNITLTIDGKNNWCTYRAKLTLPKNTPGLINSNISMQVQQGKQSPAGLFSGQYPELAYAEAGNKMAGALPRLTYYFNSTPGSFTYHTVKDDSASIPDLNQFIYYGDDKVLKSTLQQYVDFTSLNDYYKQSGTMILNSVRQPAGCLQSPEKDEQGNAGTFGFDIPETKNSLKAGAPVIVSNTWLLLKPGSPDIKQPLTYCRRFADGVGSIYPQLKKPAHHFVDWPAITEKGYASLKTLGKAHNKQLLFHQANMGSIMRYNRQFGSPAGDELMAGSDDEWKKISIALPYGDAWQYLFPLIMAGEYGEEFNNATAREVFLSGADNVVLAGQKLNYVFPLRIKADFTNPDNWRNQYDCTGAYVYLMLMYHDATKKPLYLDEAKKAGERLLKMGFEYPFEFTTSALGPVAMVRLAKATGDKKYLEGAYVPMAAILRHSWLFNPEYREYSGRTVFMLTEGMPTVYANGWEEAVMLRYMHILLKEGKDVLSKPVLDMITELLRWKAVSGADGIVPLLPDSTIIYKGIPREWSLQVDPKSYIPVEGFGYLEWDFSGQHDKLGRVSQGPYCFGMLPEAAVLLFHPLKNGAQFYCEVPVTIANNEKGADFTTPAYGTTYKCRVKGAGLSVVSIKGDAVIPLKAVPGTNWVAFTAKAGQSYHIIQKQ